MCIVSSRIEAIKTLFLYLYFPLADLFQLLASNILKALQTHIWNEVKDQKKYELYFKKKVQNNFFIKNSVDITTKKILNILD